MIGDPVRSARLKQARISRGYPTAAAAAEAFGWNRNTYSSNENGNAPFSFRRAKEYGAAFLVRPEWLYDGIGTPEPDAPPKPAKSREILAPIIGRVGADPEGRVLLATGQQGDEFVPLPPGGTSKAVALIVAGHSMRGYADDGSLIYFEAQRTVPTADMIGEVVVVETDTDEVLVKRLQRGFRKGAYNLESLNGPTRSNCRLRWAAHITAIIPPHQARRTLRSAAPSS